jgi:hypothetical protein
MRTSVLNVSPASSIRTELLADSRQLEARQPTRQRIAVLLDLELHYIRAVSCPAKIPVNPAHQGVATMAHVTRNGEKGDRLPLSVVCRRAAQ